MKTLNTALIATSAGAVLALGIMIGQATAYQGHMHAALDALRAARTELLAAEANKGGHRVEAIRLTNAAITEVQAGMAYAD